jgi:hypothetical protein
MWLTPEIDCNATTTTGDVTGNRHLVVVQFQEFCPSKLIYNEVSFVNATEGIIQHASPHSVLAFLDWLGHRERGSQKHLHQ